MLQGLRTQTKCDSSCCQMLVDCGFRSSSFPRSQVGECGFPPQNGYLIGYMMGLLGHVENSSHAFWQDFLVMTECFQCCVEIHQQHFKKVGFLWWSSTFSSHDVCVTQIMPVILHCSRWHVHTEFVCVSVFTCTCWSSFPVCSTESPYWKLHCKSKLPPHFLLVHCSVLAFLFSFNECTALRRNVASVTKTYLQKDDSCM